MSERYLFAAAIRASIERLARTNAKVLIAGDRGTGKEAIARAIHQERARRKSALVIVDCADPFSLEVFADVNVTVFLDEVAAVPSARQGALLDAILRAPARVIASTREDLSLLVRDRRFDGALQRALSAERIVVAPLSGRVDEILPLARLFAGRAAARDGRNVRGFAPAVARALTGHRWPGNVRELESCMERAVALTRSGPIALESLPEKLRIAVAGEEALTLDEMARRYVARILLRVEGNKTEAARLLGVTRAALSRMLARWEARR